MKSLKMIIFSTNLFRPDRLIITTRNKRSRLNLLENKRQNPDLLVYFNAAHLLMVDDQ